MLFNYRLFTILFIVSNYIELCRSNKVTYPKDARSLSLDPNSPIEYCRTKQNTRGTCIRVSECESAKRDLTINKPAVCYWDALEPIVCCNQDLELIDETPSRTTSSNSRSKPQNTSRVPKSETTQSNSYQQRYVGTQRPYTRNSNKPLSIRTPATTGKIDNDFTTSRSTIGRRTDTSYSTSSTLRPQSFKRNNQTNSDRPKRPKLEGNDSNDQLNSGENRNNQNDTNPSSARRDGNKQKNTPLCGKRLNLNNLPANRIVKGNETKKSEFPWTAAIFIYSDYGAVDVPPSSNTRVRTSKRKNSSSSNLKKQTTTIRPRTLRPKLNAKKLIKNLIGDHLFGFSLKHLTRTKRFINSFYPSTNYYRTRPINQPKNMNSDLKESLRTSYRTRPIRSNNYMNNPLSAAVGRPVISAINPFSDSVGSESQPMESPIVNVNPNRPSVTTENSNAHYDETGSSSTTTSSSLSTTERLPDYDVDSEDDDSDDKMKQECGGSIIGDRFILSAAHCFDNLDPNMYRVGVGSHLLKSLKIYSVKRIHMHPEYSKKRFYNDIAILELTERLEFNEDVQPICIPSRDLLKLFNLGDTYLGKELEVTFEERRSRSARRSNRIVLDSERSINTVDPNSAVVVGWGSLQYGVGTRSEKLRKAHLKLIKLADCNGMFRKLHSSLIPDGITNSNLCASGIDPNTIDELEDDDQENIAPDACQNDSGGPLWTKLSGPKKDLNRLPDKYANVINFEGDDEDSYQYGWIQIGIVSFGYRCGSKFPGVYTNVANYHNWIHSIID